MTTRRVYECIKTGGANKKVGLHPKNEFFNAKTTEKTLTKSYRVIVTVFFGKFGDS